MINDTDKTGNKNVWLVGIALLAILLSGAGYFLYTSNQRNRDLIAEKANLNRSFKDLSDTLNVRSLQIQQITDRNTELDSAITVKQEMIDAKKKQIADFLANNKMNRSELAKAKKMIAEYEADVLGMKKQIADLVAQNQLLANESLNLASSLTAERKLTANLTERNKSLSRTVQVGSLLPLTMLEIEGVKQRPNGRDRVVKKANLAESIKISFETGENKILPVGSVSLFVRVINPRGETISVTNQRSGTLTLAESVSDVQYSTRADIDWNQVNKRVSVYWKQYISDPGTYKVEIYQNGYLTGKGEVRLI